MTRRAWLRAVASAGLGTAVGVSAYGFLYERHSFVVTRAIVAIPRLPPALAGLRVGL